MKFNRKTYLLLIAFVAPFSTSFGQEAMDMNGTQWSRLTQEQKLGYAIGYIGGFDEGYTTGKADASADWMLSASSTPDKSANENDKVRKMRPNPDPTVLTYGQLRDGMDECFKDYRNQTRDISICATWAVMGVTGESNEKRDKYLEEWRHYEAHQASK